MQDKKYWEERALQREQNANKDAEKYLKELQKQFSRAMIDIENEISIFYGKYAVDNAISYQDAQEYLSPKERKAFQSRLEDFIALVQSNTNGQFNTEIRNMSNRVRITRYQALLTEIRAVVENLYGDKYTGYEPRTYNLLADVYSQSYYKSIYDTQIGLGVGTSFASLNQRAIDEAINYPWSGASFSDRIWNQKAKLLTNMRSTVTQGMIQGLSVDKMSTNLSNRMNVAYMDAERLVRTETNHVLNNATLQSYKESGIEKYEYLATLDLRTSDLCRDLDGKVFDLKDAKTGVNLPPMHVRCRSTTVAYFDDDDKSKYERAAKSPEGKYYKVPADMDYHMWYNRYVRDPKNNKIRDKIKNKEISLELSKQHYNKHVVGTKQYEAYKSDRIAKGKSSQSELTISYDEAQELIKKYAGTGIMDLNSKGEWTKKEYVNADKVIGKYIGYDFEEPTKRFAIHYSKKGAHIVPVNKK